MSKITAGAKLVSRLHKLGVQYVFCNSGTDFPPIIEGIAEAQATDRPIPEMITAPHETAALAMAHGAYFATGQTQGCDGSHKCGPCQCSDRCAQCCIGQYPHADLFRTHPCY